MYTFRQLRAPPTPSHCITTLDFAHRLLGSLINDKVCVHLFLMTYKLKFPVIFIVINLAEVHDLLPGR